MRNTVKISLFASAIALCGCSLLSPIPPTSLMNAEKALTIAHIAYNGIGQSLTIAANSGVFHGANAAQAKVYFDKAADALAVADKADSAANAQGILDAVSKAEDAIVSAKAFVKGN